MKLVKILLVIALACLLASQASASAPFDPRTVRGPRIDKLCMVIIANPDAQILAAEKGDVDILSDLTRPTDIDRLSRNQKLEMSLARGFHAFFLLLNNKSGPWIDKEVRRAAALAIDRNNIVRTIYSGYCEPINSWLPPVSPWALPESSRTIYDPAAARDLLKKLGYSWDLRGILVSPDGKPLKKLKLLTPLARVAPTTAEMAEQIADSLHAVGFPVEVEPMDFSALVSKLDRKDYSMAVLAWSMGRNPDSLYSFYHSSMDVEGGYNVTGTHDKRLDAALVRLRFAKDRAAAERASVECQRLLADIVPSVPIYSRFSVSVISKRWKNVLTTDKITADNMWTLMMAEPVEGKKRRMNMVLTEEPRSMNPFTASSGYTWQVLSMIYEALLGTDPFTLNDMPALAESWSVKTEGSGDAARTVLTYKLAKGLRWNDGSPLTAADVKATIEFLKKNEVPRYLDMVKDVRSVSVTDGSIVVRMSGVSYWYLDNIGGIPIFPKNVLGAIKDWQNWNPMDKADAYGPHGLVGCGPFMIDEYRPGEYVMMKRNPHYRMLGGAK